MGENVSYLNRGNSIFLRHLPGTKLSSLDLTIDTGGCKEIEMRPLPLLSSLRFKGRYWTYVKRFFLGLSVANSAVHVIVAIFKDV